MLASSTSSGLGIAGAALCILVGFPGHFPSTATAQTQHAGYAIEISDRLNPTGKTIHMPVPLGDGDRQLGDVTVQVDANDRLSVSKADLLARLGPGLEPKARARLQSLAAENGFISLEAAKSAAFLLTFDRASQELRYSVNLDETADTELSVGGRRQAPVSPAAAMRPSFIAGYVNVVGGLDHMQGAPGLAPSRTSGRVELDQALRVGTLVAENRALVEGDVDANVCPIGASCTYDHKSGVKRQSSRLVYDLPAHSVRIQAGDTDVTGTAQQRSLEMLGVSVTKSDTRFKPGESMQPSGRASFRIERNSVVDVLVNGNIVQQLRLRPGNYNLRDLPLATGSNNVELAITDDIGERRTLSFKSYFDTALLAAGRDEWSAAGGSLSYLRDNERHYDRFGAIGTGMYRRGLTDHLTGEAHGQADEQGGMGGVGLLGRTPWGMLRTQAAFSGSNFGLGGALNIAWDVANFQGLSDRKSDTFRIEAEYRTGNFHVPGLQLVTASGIVYPHQDYRLKIITSYSTLLDHAITAALSARYTMADDADPRAGIYTIKGDRYGVDLALSAPLSNEMSTSLTLGYTNEIYLRAFPYWGSTDPELRIGARLYWRPDHRSNVIVSHDTLTRQTTASALRSVGSGLGRWETSVNLHNSSHDGTASGSGSMSYHGNRADATVTHIADLRGTHWNAFDPSLGTQRTLLRVGSSIAFADGKVAIGPPIRGGAFAIVHPHASLAGKDVTILDGETVRARADGWGAAVVTDIPTHFPASIQYDVADLPIGYSLGTGTFELNAPYKAGYSLQVGSESSISIHGTLLKGDGKPIAYLAGDMHPENAPDQRITVFTNAVGRFGAEGLAPGRWIIVMATEGTPTRYAVDVPAGAGDLVRAGTLTPIGEGGR